MWLLLLLQCRRLILELTFNLYFLSVAKKKCYVGNYLFKEFSELLFDTFSSETTKASNFSAPEDEYFFVCSFNSQLSLKIRSYTCNTSGLDFTTPSSKRWLEKSIFFPTFFFIQYFQKESGPEIVLNQWKSLDQQLSRAAVCVLICFYLKRAQIW